MHDGDKVKRAEESSAIRILPPDDTFFRDGEEFGVTSSPRWRIPGVVAGAVLAVFLFSTQPGGTADNPETPSLAPPLAAIEIEIETKNVDLTQPPRTIEEWASAPLDPGTEINSILRHSSILAIGSSEGTAQAWVSGNGSAWRPSIDIETPERPSASLDHAVYWDGAVIALSLEGDTAGVWRSRTADNWQHQGEFTGVRSQSITGLAGGEQLLALETFDGGVQGWASPDAQQWVSLGMLNTLSDISINSLDATEQWYLAGGRSHPDLSAGKPVIYRSSDGVTWEPVDGEGPGVLSTATGEVTALTTYAGTIYATGSIIAEEGVVVATWKSEDGIRWDRIGADAAAFLPTTITMRAQGAGTGDNARATIWVNRDRLVVSIGSEVATNDGTFIVDNVADRLVQLRHGDEQISLVVNMNRRASSTELVVSGQTNNIAVEGPRIVLAGSIQVGALTTPALWSSTDAGQTWERSTIPETVGELADIVTVGPNIVALGGTVQEPEMWRNTWNTQPMADHAGAIATRYIHALEARDLPALLGLLPSASATLTSPKFAVPSLGSYNQSWWDPETGFVDADRVGDTLDYLEATDTRLDLGECATGVGIGTVDRATATCEFSASSNAMSALGIEGQGRLRATFANGVFEGVFLDVAPANAVWELLAAGVGNAPAAEQRTLISYDEEGNGTVQPTFDAASAAVHARLTSRFVAGLLEPNGTRTVETELGAMEWRWITDADGSLGYFSSVAWNHSEFLASAHTFGDTTPAVLHSDNGIDWTDVEVPPEIEGLWDLHAFGSGWIAQAWKPDQPMLVFFDGSSWTEISLLGSGEDGIVDIAVSGDRILALVGRWSEEHFTVASRAILIGPDLAPIEVSMPADYDWSNHNLGLAGNEDGFLLAMEDSFEPAALTVWHSTDANTWRVVSESAPIDDAISVFGMQGRRSQYFVVGQTMERRCTRTADGEQCALPLGMWTSPDGEAWDRLIARNGTPVSANAIGAGELGLVAVGRSGGGLVTPSIIYLSTDGRSWEQLGDLSLYMPDAEWWDLNSVAVGDNTIVVTGSSYSPAAVEPTQSGFLVVGRLVDP